MTEENGPPYDTVHARAARDYRPAGDAGTPRLGAAEARYTP